MSVYRWVRGAAASASLSLFLGARMYEFTEIGIVLSTLFLSILTPLSPLVLFIFMVLVRLKTWKIMATRLMITRKFQLVKYVI